MRSSHCVARSTEYVRPQYIYGVIQAVAPGSSSYYDYGSVSSGQRPRYQQRSGFVRQNMDLEYDLDEEIRSARVGIQGITQKEAEHMLARLPWYGQSIRGDLRAQNFTRTLAAWNDSKIVDCLLQQQHALSTIKQILHLIVSATEVEDMANVTGNTMEDFSEYFWTEVKSRLGQSVEKRSFLSRLGLSSTVCDRLLDADDFRRKNRDEDSGEDALNTDVQSDAETLLDILATEMPNLMVDEERLKKSLVDCFTQVKETVNQCTATYKDVVLRLLTNPMVPGDNGFEPNSYGQFKPLYMLQAEFGGGGGVPWHNQDRALPSPEFSMIGNPSNSPIAALDGTFVTPFASIVPTVNQGWREQIEMMEFLGRPIDETTAHAKAAKLKEVLTAIEKHSQETIEALSLGFRITNAVSDVLRSMSWKNQRADIRWYKACVMTKLNEIMRVSKLGSSMSKLMGGPISRPARLDYEYLRLLAQARIKDRYGAAALVYQWLTSKEVMGDTLYPVIVQGSYDYDDNVSMSRARLDLAGLSDHIIKGDVDTKVPPLYITAESMYEIEETTKVGEQVPLVDRMEKPRKESNVKISRMTKGKDDTNPFSEVVRCDEDRFPLIKNQPYGNNSDLKSVLKHSKNNPTAERKQGTIKFSDF